LQAVADAVTPVGTEGAVVSEHASVVAVAGALRDDSLPAPSTADTAYV
jgi:hypothetical protein